MKKKDWCFMVFMTWCCSVVAYNFHDGLDHHYIYTSESEVLGKTNITIVCYLRVHPVNQSEDGTRVNRLKLDSIVIHQGNEFLIQNPRKWNLSTDFLFTMGSDGLIDLIHYHRDDEMEAVFLKKAIVSIFSAKSRTVHSGSVVNFTNVELDHSGLLEHSYQIHRTPNGQTVHKTHRSNDHYHRAHNKSLTYDRAGVLQHATAKDHVFLDSQTEQATSTRKPIKGEFIIQDKSTGDFPDVFSSFAISQLRLERTSIPKNKHHSYTTDQFTSDSILIQTPEEEKKSLTEVNNTMSSLVACILENNTFSNTSAESGCVDDLWHLLGTLKPKDFRNLMKDVLELDCSDSDTQCTRHRGLFVDMLSRRGDELSQSLIVSLILKSPRASEEEMQRCLFHLVALEKPSIELMSAVEDICMGENESFTEIESLSNTQRRSCLSLGALVKNMKLHHLSYADKVTAKIEKWLNTKGRALELEESSGNDGKKSQYIVTKMTLLHVLGNAGMERSLEHITSFMEPNAGPAEWRRAAVASLKHFTCNKSADFLLRSVLHDGNRQVKQDAYEAFLSHPNKGKLTVPQKDAILSTSYDYPTLLRLRRSVVTYSASLKDGLYFGISLPGIHWKKVIGNSAIGAEFGIILRNNLELELSQPNEIFLIITKELSYRK